MRIGIVGGGAIGLLVACYLHESKFDVTIYTHSKRQASKLSSYGITLLKDGVEQQYHVNAVPFYQSTYKEDLLFIAVKQYHLQDVISQLKGKLPLECGLIFLQNGMGHLHLLEKMDDHSINIGIVEHGALKHSDSLVEHTGVGALKIGVYNFNGDHVNEVCKTLTVNGFLTTIHEDWLPIMKRKLVVNAVINPLTALYSVENGQLLQNIHFKNNMYRLFTEAVHVLNLQSHSEGLWNDLIQICEKTSRNRSSMLRDFDAKRSSEIDAICGYLIKLAKKKAITIPFTEFMYESIKGLEEHHLGGESDVW